MGTIVYQTPNPYEDSASCAVGQVAYSGIVYTTPFGETATAAVGQICEGVVYNRLNVRSWEFAVGHINADGIIYSTPVTEYNSDAIGHVNGAGVVYNNAFGEYNEDIVGHVKGPDRLAAAAALLLLLYNPAKAREHEDSYQPYKSKLVDEMADMFFGIADKPGKQKMACKACGKTLSLKDYSAQEGLCLTCRAKEATWKENVRKNRYNYFNCPHCKKTIKLGKYGGILRTKCPFAGCGKPIAMDTANGRIIRE